MDGFGGKGEGIVSPELDITDTKLLGVPVLVRWGVCILL